MLGLCVWSEIDINYEIRSLLLFYENMDNEYQLATKANSLTNDPIILGGYQDLYLYTLINGI